MWPKMLLELIPHFVRLLPMADKFFASRGASDKAQEAAFSAMTEELRGERSKVTEMHADIDRALQAQGAQVAEIGVEVTRARIGVESLEARVARLENTAAIGLRMAAVALLMLASALVLLVMVLLHVSRH